MKNSYREFYPGVEFERIKNARGTSELIKYRVLELRPPMHALVMEVETERTEVLAVRDCTIVFAPKLTPSQHLERLGGSRKFVGETVITLRDLCAKYPEWGLQINKGVLSLRDETQVL